MGFKFNPLTGDLDLVNKTPPNPLIAYGFKLEYLLSSLAAYDKVASITYHDFGMRNQRINQVVLSSVQFPNADVTKTIFYLDVGSIDQRIEKVEYDGAIFLPGSLRKLFNYSVSGIGYKLDGYEYEIF